MNTAKLALDSSLTSYAALKRKMEKDIECWSRLSISLTTKITVLKSYILPILSFHSSFVAINQETILKIKTLIRKLICNGKRSKVSYEKLMKPKDCGGLNAPDIEAVLSAPKVRWVFRLMEQRDQPWASPASLLISELNSEYGHGLSSLFLKTKTRASKIPSKIWQQTISSFWKIDSCINLDLEHKETPNTIRSMPLFNNPLIGYKGKPLKSEQYKKLASKGSQNW